MNIHSITSERFRSGLRHRYNIRGGANMMSTAVVTSLFSNTKVPLNCYTLHSKHLSFLLPFPPLVRSRIHSMKHHKEQHYMNKTETHTSSPCSAITLVSSSCFRLTQFPTWHTIFSHPRNPGNFPTKLKYRTTDIG